MVGGLAGSFAVLAGAAAVDPPPQVVPIVLAIVLFLWTPPHFWSLAAAQGRGLRRGRRADAARSSCPAHAWTLAILPHTVALVAISLVPLWFGMGCSTALGAGIGGGYLPLEELELCRTPTKQAAMAQFPRLAAAALSADPRRRCSMAPFGVMAMTRGD